MWRSLRKVIWLPISSKCSYYIDQRSRKNFRVKRNIGKMNDLLESDLRNHVSEVKNMWKVGEWRDNKQVFKLFLGRG